MRLGIVGVVGLVACKGSAQLEFTQPNNYVFTNDITMQVTEVQPQTNLTLDWSSLTTDVRERPLDPATVEQITLAKFAYPFADLVPLFGTNDIDAQAEASEIYLLDSPGLTNATSTTFEITGIPFVPADLILEDPNVTWTVSAVNYPGGRLDLLMSRAFVPVSTSSNTQVDLGDGDTSLEWTVDMHSQPEIEAEAGANEYALDWSGVTKDVYGHTFDPIAANELLIGHYEGDVTYVEENFLQLDTVTTEIYRMSVIGVTEVKDLGDAVTDGGDEFPGFSTDGTWLIGFTCPACSTPVPLALGVVSVK